MRSTSAVRARSSRGRVSLPLLLGLLAALLLAIVWLAGRDDAEPAAPAAGEIPVAPASPVLPEATSRGVAPDPVREPAAEAVPLSAVPDESLPGRDIAGVLVRASDGSNLGPAEVIALVHVAGTAAEVELMRTRADTDGHFELRAERGPTGFRVLVPPAGRPRDAEPTQSVGVSVEWAGGDPAAHDVRLVLDTGWRLDVRVLDAQGQPRADVVLRAAGRETRTDAEGAGALVDLPEDGRALTLRAQAPGQPEISQQVPAPAEGRLRAELQLTLR
jgi:hypothetical protein